MPTADAPAPDQAAPTAPTELDRLHRLEAGVDRLRAEITRRAPERHYLYAREIDELLDCRAGGA